MSEISRQEITDMSQKIYALEGVGKEHAVHIGNLQQSDWHQWRVLEGLRDVNHAQNIKLAIIFAAVSIVTTGVGSAVAVLTILKHMKGF